MKQLVLFLSIITAILAVETSEILSIKKADEFTIITTQSSSLKVGEEAYIVRDLDSGTSIIGFRCLATSKTQNLVTIRCSKFTDLYQDAMPKINFEAKIRDKVVLKPMGNRATILTTSQNKYLKLQSHFKEYNLIHPDLFAVELTKEANPTPSKEDFKNFCNKFYVSTIIFDFSNEVVAANCQSFKKTRSFTKREIKDKEPIKPFFHRLETIETGFWDWFSASEIEGFDKYYRGFIDDK